MGFLYLFVFFTVGNHPSTWTSVIYLITAVTKEHKKLTGLAISIANLTEC